MARYSQEDVLGLCVPQHQDFDEGAYCQEPLENHGFCKKASAPNARASCSTVESLDPVVPILPQTDVHHRASELSPSDHAATRA
jgi:hypothetical protein